MKLSLDDKLSQEYPYQKLLKSDNPSLRYSRKFRGCFFGTQCIFAEVVNECTIHNNSTSWPSLCQKLPKLVEI